jgi:hypothetical protein
MDVEGSERFVLEGGGATFERFRPTLFTELNTMCLAKYFGVTPDSYFTLLRKYYGFIYALLPTTGAIIPLNCDNDLSTLLTPQRWWADLVCAPGPL